MNISFRRNLGFIYDAYHIITCKTASRESWIKTFIKNGNEASDLQRLEEVLSRFDDVDPKMLLFGYKDRKKGSFIGNIVLKYADENIGNWSTEDFVQYLLNVERTKNLVADFYFDHDANEQIFEDIASDTSLSGNLKSLLYEFFLFPDRYLSLFETEINKVFSTLQQYYSENFDLLLESQESFDYSSLKQSNSPFAKNKRWDQGLRNCYVSFSLLSKYATVRGKTNNEGWLLLGYDFFSAFGEMSEVKLDIAAFGNAFGDKLRVKIIEEIVKNGELTLADLSKKLGVVNTIVIYHLDILKKENLLLHRYQGRKVLYCLNISRLNQGLSAIRTLCGGVEE